MTHFSHPSPESLVEEHSNFVRALARHLVQSESQAEELAQETWLRTLENPPANSSRVRSWLSVVARNKWRVMKRAERRRASRERFAAMEEAVPSTARLVERRELMRAVCAAVNELEEPYRSTVWQRFYDQRPPREIAKIEGVSVETVKARLKRGLAKIRQRLDRHLGSRDRWVRVLVPLAFGSRRTGRVAIALAGMGVVGLLSGLGGLAFVLPSPHSDPGVSSSPVDPRHSPVAQRASLDPVPASMRTVLVDEAGRASFAEGVDVVGRVVDPKGKPVFQARVELHTQVLTEAREKTIFKADTGPDGEFLFNDVLDPSVHISFLYVFAEGWATARITHPVQSSAPDLRGRRLEEIRLEEPQVIRGRVIDREGSPIAGARLSFCDSFVGVAELIERESEFGFRVESLERLRWSREDGTFDCDSLVRGKLRLDVVAEGYGPAMVQIVGREEVEVVLSVAKPLEGRFVSAGARPLAPLEVVAYIGEDHGVVVEAREDGSFRLPHVPLGGKVLLQASYFGNKVYSQRFLFNGKLLEDIPLSSDARLELQLVDSRGEPAASTNVFLWIWDRLPPQKTLAWSAPPPSGMLSRIPVYVDDGRVCVEFLPRLERVWYQILVHGRNQGVLTGSALLSAPHESNINTIHVNDAPRDRCVGIQVDVGKQGSAFKLLAHKLRHWPNQGKDPEFLYLGDSVLDIDRESIHALPMDERGRATYSFSESYSVCFVATDGDRIAKATVGESDSINLRLKASASFMGTVYFDGQPMDQALVALWDGKLFYETTLTNASGEFSLSPLPSGRYHVSARLAEDPRARDGYHYWVPSRRADWVGRVPSLVLEPGASVRRDIQVVDPRSATLVVRVPDGHKGRIVTRRIGASRPRDLFQVLGAEHRVNCEGEVVIGGLAQGRFLVELKPLNRREPSSQATVDLGPSQRVIVEF